YDPERKTLYRAVANPKPYTRLKRHGSAEGTAQTAPADLYSNSTLALDIETGQLKWYYQHLPGDDWDLDHIHERTLLRTAVNPDPGAVKWINPNIARGQERDLVVEVGEAGGTLGVGPPNGQVLRATPLRVTSPAMPISDVTA